MALNYIIMLQISSFPSLFFHTQNNIFFSMNKSTKTSLITVMSKQTSLITDLAKRVIMVGWCDLKGLNLRLIP